jgi:CBS-domain-containing membrane protein
LLRPLRSGLFGEVADRGHAPVAEVVETMLEHKVGAIPMVDGEGQVVGINGYVDVLRAMPFPGVAELPPRWGRAGPR